ncbi:MAG: HTH domain-containing protein [Phycisphaerales bacterium]
MKKDEVKIGETYTAKVSDKVVPVRLDKENPRGGWDATNLVTNKQVRIKSAQRLRGRVGAPATDADAGKAKHAAKPPIKKKLTAAERKARRQQPSAKADKPKPAAKKTDAPKEKKLSLIDAAVQVLGKSGGEPMGTKEMVEQITAQNLWSPRSGGKTPHATLYSAILREIQKKGQDARFQKTERGRFTLAKGA